MSIRILCGETFIIYQGTVYFWSVSGLLLVFKGVCVSRTQKIIGLVYYCRTKLSSLRVRVRVCGIIKPLPAYLTLSELYGLSYFIGVKKSSGGSFPFC